MNSNDIATFLANNSSIAALVAVFDGLVQQYGYDQTSTCESVGYAAPGPGVYQAGLITGACIEYGIPPYGVQVQDAGGVYGLVSIIPDASGNLQFSASTTPNPSIQQPQYQSASGNANPTTLSGMALLLQQLESALATAGGVALAVVVAAIVLPEILRKD